MKFAASKYAYCNERGFSGVIREKNQAPRIVEALLCGSFNHERRACGSVYYSHYCRQVVLVSGVCVCAMHRERCGLFAVTSPDEMRTRRGDWPVCSPKISREGASILVPNWHYNALFKFDNFKTGIVRKLNFSPFIPF